MKTTLLLLLTVVSLNAEAYQLNQVTVSGERGAEVVLEGSPAIEPAPQIATKDGVIEMTFSGAELAEKFQGKLDLNSPHALIGRMSVYSTGRGILKAKLVINGSEIGLKDRISLVREGASYRLKLEYPKSESPSLALMREEQQPLNPAVAAVPHVAEPRYPKTQIALILLTLIGMGVACYFALKALKGRGQARGSRKYLIEQLSYYPLGPKSGVSLIKVGREFVLVGVTPSQITTLSTLPKLGAQYEEDSAFEKDTFREAVREEIQNQTRGNKHA